MRTVLRPALIALGLLACARAPAPAPEPAVEDVRRLAAALDLVATDYARAVAGGRVVDEAAYQRQRQMLHDARSYAGYVPHAEGVVAEVTALVEERAEPPRVAEVARAARAALLAAHGPVAVPIAPPARPRAAQLWSMMCAGCHGTGGVGDGPQGLFLDPEPRNFRDPEIMTHLSPLRAYSAITDGIPSTAMPSAATFSSEERWGLAFLVLGLRHGAADLARGRDAWARAGGLPPPSPTRLAAMTDGDILAVLGGRGLDGDAARSALAWLRVEAAFSTAPSRLGRARAALVAALAANRRGDARQATEAVDRGRAALFPDAAVLGWRDPELAARLFTGFDRAEDLARDGVLDEILEAALRRVSVLLDQAEEELARR